MTLLDAMNKAKLVDEIEAGTSTNTDISAEQLAEAIMIRSVLREHAYKLLTGGIVDALTGILENYECLRESYDDTHWMNTPEQVKVCRKILGKANKIEGLE